MLSTPPRRALERRSGSTMSQIMRARKIQRLQIQRKKNHVLGGYIDVIRQALITFLKTPVIALKKWTVQPMYAVV
jgi:hypothetical protein